MREAIGAETPPLPANVELCHQIVSPGCTVVCAMEMGTPHTVNHIRAPYRATVQELHVANSWKVTPDGHFAGQCTDGQRTYSVKKGKTIRKGDELLVVYGSYYWQELRRGMGCTQTQCAHNCPFRVNDDETEPAMGDWVQNGVVHREEDGQPTHDTGDVAESAQQSEGQLEQNTRCHNPPHILGRNKWAYASNVLVGKSWMGGLVAAKDIPAGVMIVRYSGKETDLGTEVDSEYLMVATSTKDRFERSW